MVARHPVLRVALRAAVLWWMGFAFLARAAYAFAACFGIVTLFGLWFITAPDNGAELTRLFPEWRIALQVVISFALVIWPVRWLALGKFP